MQALETTVGYKLYKAVTSLTDALEGLKHTRSRVWRDLRQVTFLGFQEGEIKAHSLHLHFQVRDKTATYCIDLTYCDICSVRCALLGLLPTSGGKFHVNSPIRNILTEKNIDVVQDLFSPPL
ncbi:hypothetical protein JOB18_041780 [Solea senegalensis]|uniref:Uncharacterized protein n=1 Tax=Solea senegalensis TaxID=28829 RepID=A0AAV6SHJ1_SOLSE|nr:hypothetical protein JOB18_041780 [Solea senegalensis]